MVLSCILCFHAAILQRSDCRNYIAQLLNGLPHVINQEYLDGSRAHVGDGFFIEKQLFDRLFGYQRDGLLFLWRLFRQNKGGVLGDDMG